MNEYYEKFLELLENEDKEGCVEFALSKIENQELDVPTLYTEVLTPALNNIKCKLNEREICIWKEHVRSAIVRTIIECCYPYILKYKKDSAIKDDKGKALVLCPPEEYHEIGARMVADFFSLSGYDTIFVGSNTPREDFISAINYIKPKYVAISVTNYYNLIATKEMINRIRQVSDKDLSIIVGGNAFLSNVEAYLHIGADKLLKDFQDIKNLP